ncbi:MAG: 6,7-dimethyl-8-ribityllumazine synthase [Actinobacteria bacterium RBG_16_70_17]|nr:MAG: 6,7-dimethyl-8-ribityllumazine synthase [Actinobacteria bacterium RBG_16_70_17]
MPEIEGAGDASGLRVGVVVATFNEVVTAGLLQGALEALLAAGAVDPTVVRVAGSFEIPVVARALAEGGCDCVVALGAVIKGETDHYEHVATQAIAGLRQVAVETGVPVGLGVLTTRRVEHARARSLPGPGNKGAEAALAAVRAANALRLLPRPSDG